MFFCFFTITLNLSIVLHWSWREFVSIFCLRSATLSLPPHSRWRCRSFLILPFLPALPVLEKTLPVRCSCITKHKPQSDRRWTGTERNWRRWLEWRLAAPSPHHEQHAEPPELRRPGWCRDGRLRHVVHHCSRRGKAEGAHQGESSRNWWCQVERSSHSVSVEKVTCTNCVGNVRIFAANANKSFHHLKTGSQVSVYNLWM